MDDAVSRETWEGWRCEVEQLTDQTAVLNTYKGDNLIYTERMPSRVARWHAEAHNDRAALEAVCQHDWRSIAFPAIERGENIEPAWCNRCGALSSRGWHMPLNAEVIKHEQYRDKLESAEQALTAERERADELARKLDVELLRRDTERPIWERQLQAEREKAARYETALSKAVEAGKNGEKLWWLNYGIDALNTPTTEYMADNPLFQPPSVESSKAEWEASQKCGAAFSESGRGSDGPDYCELPLGHEGKHGYTPTTEVK